MTTKDLDDRIHKLKDEQQVLSANHDRATEHLNQLRVRYTQINGAIAELQDLKKSLNGELPPPP